MSSTHTRSVRWTIVVTILLAFFSLLALVARPRHQLWPALNDWAVYAYSDKVTGGTSMILDYQRGPKILMASFQLSDAEDAYAGVGFRMKGNGFGDASRYSHLRIEYRAHPADSLCVQLILDVAGYTRPTVPASHRFLVADLPPSEDWTILSIPLSEFKTPEWWYDTYPATSWLSDPPDFSRLVRVEICGSEQTPAWKRQEVNIRSACLESRWWPVFVPAALMPLPFLILLFSRGWGRFQVKRHASGSTVEMSTQEESDFRQVSQLIASRYPEPELSVSSIHAETGIPEGKISQMLEKRTGFRFKQYLNQIRISEAARLLAESDRTIGEIAFMVGYANTTHFNRVFRSLKKISPSEFRRSNQGQIQSRVP